MQFCKVIILDFDGTILESVDIKDKAFRKLFEGYPLKIEDIMSYHLAHNATIRFEKFKYITETILGLPYDRKVEEGLGKKFSNMVFEQIIAAPYVEGVKEFITFFAKKVALYIVSMSPHEEFMKIINAKQLSGYFKDIYTYPWKKDKAAVDIIAREQVLPSEVIFIGDAKEDGEAAHAAGVSFIGRNSGKPLSSLGGPVFRNFNEIKTFINTNFVVEPN